MKKDRIPSTLDALKNTDLLQEEFNIILQENNSLKTENADLQFSLEKALQKISWFEEQIKLSRQRQYGKKTESSEQLELPFLNIFNGEESEGAVQAAGATETITYIRQRGEKKGRNVDTSLLPRCTVIHDLDENEKTCQDCHHHLEKMGEDKSEQLEIIQEPLIVVEHIRYKYVCRHCDAIKMAKKDPAPIPKSMASASLLTSVIVNKYQNHLPLYRQSQMLKSHQVDISDSTLSHWIMQCGEALLPLWDVQLKEVIESSYAQADETPVKVLKPDKKGYLWAYLSPEKKAVVFDFSLSRSKEAAERHLKNFSGRLQTDGYAGYQRLREQNSIIALGCFSHTRRKFVEIAKLTPKKPGKATEAIEFFSQLYKIEAQAREKELTHQERYQLRQERSRPILDRFYQWLQAVLPGTPRQGALYPAIRYALNQWPYLSAVMDHGEVELDTNLVENQIRPFAIGRKNWLFVGHEKSAKIGALFYSLIQTCKLQNLNPALYLHYVLNRVHDLRKGNISAEALLPKQFAQSFLKQAWHHHQSALLNKIVLPST